MNQSKSNKSEEDAIIVKTKDNNLTIIPFTSSPLIPD